MKRATHTSSTETPRVWARRLRSVIRVSLLMAALLAWMAQAPAAWAQDQDEDGDAAYEGWDQELKESDFIPLTGGGSLCSSPITINFDGFAPGTIITNQISGVEISTDRWGGDGAMIFDSTCPNSPSPGGCSGDDDDLGTPNQAFGGEGIGSGGGSNNTAQGNILIITEDNDSSDPDDHASGGILYFDYDADVTIHGVDFVDLDDGSPSAILKAYNAAGTQVGSSVYVSPAGNNSFKSVAFNRPGVRRLKVVLKSSGSVSAVRYCGADLECQSNPARPLDGTWGYINITDASRSCPDNVPVSTCPEANLNDVLEFTFPFENTGSETTDATARIYYDKTKLGYVSGGTHLGTGGPGDLAGIEYSLNNFASGDVVNVTARVKVIVDPPGRLEFNMLADIATSDFLDIDSSPGNKVIDGVATSSNEDDECGAVVVLPVELVSFEAVIDGRAALLAWQTVSETNNAGFEVQHRYLGEADKASSAFASLGFVDGAGTTLEAQTYTFRAEDLTPGRHVFRLKQLDYDGTFEYSPEIEVSVGIPEAFLVSKVYPNPFNPEASLSFGVKQEQAVRVELFNVLGQRVKVLYEGRPAAGTTQTLRIDGSGLRSGVYILRVQGERFVDTQTVTLIK